MFLTTRPLPGKRCANSGENSRDAYPGKRVRLEFVTPAGNLCVGEYGYPGHRFRRLFGHVYENCGPADQRRVVVQATASARTLFHCEIEGSLFTPLQFP